MKQSDSAPPILTRALLNREQRKIIQQNFDFLDKMVFVPKPLSYFAENPFHVVGGLDFVPTISPAAFGNICDFADRWQWITTEMLPVWQQPGTLVSAANYNRAVYVGANDFILVWIFPFE